MAIVLNNTHAKYHKYARHTCPLTEANLFRSDAQSPYWMKATAMAFFSMPGLEKPLSETSKTISGASLYQRHSIMML